jgi:hypothetical protein
MVLELSALISSVLSTSDSHRVRARTLAKVSGKIIATTPAVGFITQIMTRCMFSALNEKLNWNNNLNIYHKQDCIRALKDNKHNSTAFISLQVELLPASNFNHVLNMTKCEFLIKPAAPISLASVKISYADSFSNKNTGFTLEMFNFQNISSRMQSCL